MEQCCFWRVLKITPNSQQKSTKCNKKTSIVYTMQQKSTCIHKKTSNGPQITLTCQVRIGHDRHMKKPTQSELAKAITDHQPTKNMSILRGLMPVINEGLDRGMSKKEIWEGLFETGLSITYKNFLTCLTRIKQRDLLLGGQSNTTVQPSSSPQVAPKAKEPSAQKETSTVAAIAQARKESSATDYSKVIRENGKPQRK